MFQASHPFTFLDYHGVPYEVASAHAGTTVDSLPFLGQLRSRSCGARPARVLTWMRFQAGAELAHYCPAGLYRMEDSWIAGHVAPDACAMRWLPRIGTDWRPIRAVRNEKGSHVSSVWRDRDGNVFLPFDMDEVMRNSWSERYYELTHPASAAVARGLLLRGYYLIKPGIPRKAQLALRRAFARRQASCAFPRWPVEDSLHDLYLWLLGVLAELHGDPVPHLGMWPRDRSWALVLTHDVDTEIGHRNVHLLREPERLAGYRSSWNFVPERYAVDPSVLQRLREEGCEIGVHGLRHDGRDLGPRKIFEQRLPSIRSYAEQWGAVGFRSPATHRVWEWMPELGFDYDSSYPDTDPYEPQPGGCCSYLPFFNQEQVELPITLPQDHTLFAILGLTDGDVWIDKARHLRDRGGMALVLTHPDYAMNPSLLRAWKRLLDEFRDDDTVWRALPREVACWWRRRAASVIRETNDGWRVEGPAAGEARIRTATPPTRSAHVLTSPVPSERPRSGSDRATAPHVLIVVENVAFGEDHRVRKQVQDLLTAGYRVSVVTKSDPANEAYYERPGLTVLEYPAPPEPESLLGYVREYAVSFAWAATLSIKARLGDRFDVLQVCQPPDIYFPIARLHKLLGAAVLVDQRDLMPELFALRQERSLPAVPSFLRWLERRTQRAADEAICTNEYQKARLIAAGAAPNRVTLVLNGPVHDRVLGTAPDSSLRGEFSSLCCWIGKMGRQDRVDLALRTVEHAVHDLGRKDVGFVFLGNGECLEEAQALSTQLGLDPWVSFTGWVPESTVFTYLASADLGIDASLQGDVSPVKIFEYMAFGVAFVSFDLPETRTIGTGAGLFAPSGDVPALARALIALLDDPDQRAELGRAGRDRVRDQLAWEHQATRYLTVVDRLVSRGRRPSRRLGTAAARELTPRIPAIEDAEALS